jgi:CHAT domain-containing protein
MKTFITHLAAALLLLGGFFSCKQNNGETSLSPNLSPEQALGLAQANFDAACYDEALFFCKTAFGSAAPAVAFRSNLLAGRIHALRYEPEQAEAFFQKAKSQCGQLADDTLLAQFHLELSWHHFHRFDWKTALAEARTSLALHREIFGEKSPETAASLVAVGRNLQEIQERGTLDSSLVYLQKALDIQREMLGEESVEAGVTLMYMANAWRLLMKDHKGLAAAEKAVHIFEKCGLQNHPLMAEAQLMKAMELSAVFRGNETEDEFETALGIFSRVFGENSIQCGRVWQAMGEGFQNRQMFGDQLDHSLKAVAIFDRHRGGELPWAALAWRYMGRAYEELQRHKDVQPCYNKAAALMKKFWGEDSRYLADCMTRWGRSFNTAGDSTTALKICKEAVEMYTRLGEPDCVGAGLARWNVGMNYYENSDWKPAGDWMIPGFETIVAADSITNPRIPLVSCLIAEVYMWQRRFDKRFEIYQTGAKSLGLDKNPALIDSVGFESEVKRVMGALKDSYYMRFMETGDTSYLHKAHGVSLAFLRMVRKQLAETANDESRQTVKRDHYYAYDHIIYDLMGINKYENSPKNIEEAFKISEELKALFLFEGTTRDEAMRRAGISNQVIEKTHLLRIRMNELEERFRNSDFFKDKAQIISIRSQLFEARQAYQKHLKKLELQFPSYADWKNREYMPGIKTIQEKLLDEHTVLFEFHLITFNSVVVFLITQNDTQFIYCQNTPTTLKSKLLPVVDTFRQSIKPQWNEPDSVQFQRLVSSATTLYDSILRLPLAKLDTSINRLIIIPDDFLSQIPFELLGDYTAWKNKPPVSFSELPFLMKKYTIQYAPSCHLLLHQMEQKRAKAPKLFAGFAPEYESSDTLAPLLATRSALVRDGIYDLPGAKDEVKTVAALTAGKTFLGHSANEKAFKSAAANYRILHFAAHSQVDENNPNFSRLLLSHSPGDTSEDSNLNAIELQNLELRADLAVLSACNTGTGLVRSGEGSVSLARAFMQAGVPATVMSLWKVPDEATRHIMVEFYKNLKAGQRKDDALRNAKLTYLASVKDPWLASPFYWAGFVAAGDMRPIEMETEGWNGWWWVVGLAGLSLLAGWWLCRRKIFPFSR